jgi:hypothetical protein
MSEESLVQKLVEQCKNSGMSLRIPCPTLIDTDRITDVDVKVDALTKLQAEFERGAQVDQ